MTHGTTRNGNLCEGFVECWVPLFNTGMAPRKKTSAFSNKIHVDTRCNNNIQYQGGARPRSIGLPIWKAR